MKRIIVTIVATLISTAVIADTKNGQSKPVGTAGEGFIYGGFGPNNDSR